MEVLKEVRKTTCLETLEALDKLLVWEAVNLAELYSSAQNNVHTIYCLIVQCSLWHAFVDIRYEIMDLVRFIIIIEHAH